MIVVDRHSGQAADLSCSSRTSRSPDSPPVALRARAIADANALRALAWAALRDGSPKAELRAAAARSSARAVIVHARRLSAILAKYDRPWTRGLRRYPVA